MASPPMGGVTPMPAPQPSSGIDFARLQEMWKNTAPPQPVYPSWYKTPKRPNAQQVHEVAIRRSDR